MSDRKKITVAIDGPAGSGKSSTAQKVAQELGYLFLDSGAMYRAVTLHVLQDIADPNDTEATRLAAEHSDIEFVRNGEGQRVYLNGVEVTEVIRKPLVTNNIAPVAANPAVREILVEKQRAIGAHGGIVAEGRDIGTVVFKDAELKIFMNASIEERAKRRQKEMIEKGLKVDIERLEHEIRQRDKSDSTREHGALKKAPDAVEVDTSNLTIDEQVAFIVAKAKERGA